MKRKWILIIAAIMLLVLVTGFFIIYPKMKTDMEAKQKFKEIMGFDLPDNTKVNRYHYNSQNGFCAIDLVFDANEYDNVFQTFQRNAVDRYHPMIFQKEAIYEADDFEEYYPLYAFDEYPVLSEFPYGLNWVQEEPMEFIVGYDAFSPGRDGAITGATDWLFVRDSHGKYHVMIQAC